MRGLVSSMVGLMVLLAAGLGLAAEKASTPTKNAAAAEVVQPRNAKTGVLDLRKIAKPSATLAGKTYDLVPGGTLRFVVREHVAKGRVTHGFGEVTAPAGVTVKRTVLVSAPTTDAGGTARVEYRVTLPLSAKPGLYEIKTASAASGKTSADWVARFSLRIAPRLPGEPRPL